MTVPCTGCGREYDPARFAGGRTLHCACGTQVGQRLETGALTSPGEPRFLADSMLGKLARLFRSLGYDTAWEPEIADAELVRRGVEERRIILTRDRRLARDWWVDGLVLVESEAPLQQLREIADRFRLTADRLFARCTRCNVPVQPAAPEDVAPGVPPGVREHQHSFTRCPACARIYWEGSHTERMRRTLTNALE